MGWKQTIKLPAAMDENAPDKDDLNIIRNEEIKAIAKRCQKLEESLKKGFATVYDQCLQEVKEKLESTKEWEKTQKEQCLHELIQKIEQICVGFDDHKQDIFNLVQALRSLFSTPNPRKRRWRNMGETLRAYGTLLRPSEAPRACTRR